MDEKTIDPASVQGVKYLKRLFGMLERLAPAGTQRDRAGNRQLLFSQYAGLVLLGLFNPTLQALHALSQASALRKVQKAIGGGRASIGSLSESVRVFDPQLLAPLLEELLEAVPPATGSRGGGIPEELVRRLVAVDGSALQALPQIVAAAGGGPTTWRLHLQFEVLRGLPLAAAVTHEGGGEADERSVLARTLQPGRVYLCDRGYERYALFEQIAQAGSDYLIRVQRRAVEVVEQRPLSEAARAAGVLADEIVRLGRSRGEVGEVTHTVRRIALARDAQGRRRTDRPQSDELLLMTNLVEVPPEILAALYRLRWLIELFFRFFKHVLGCRHLLSHKPEGIAIQVYCALIAALLLALSVGRDVGRRGFELLCLYLQGWAEEDELLAGLARLTRAKKRG
jgi:hypothetical protein